MSRNELAFGVWMTLPAPSVSSAQMMKDVKVLDWDNAVDTMYTSATCWPLESGWGGGDGEEMMKPSTGAD